MKYKVQITKNAAKSIKKLGKDTKERINKALRATLDYYEEIEKAEPDIKQLKGKYKGLLRLRIGDLRIIFKLDGINLIIMVLEVVKRGDAYKE